LFFNIETESVLTKGQQEEIEKRYQNLKSGVSKGTSLIDFKNQMREKYGL